METFLYIALAIVFSILTIWLIPNTIALITGPIAVAAWLSASEQYKEDNK